MADRKDSKIPGKGGMVKKKEKKVEKVESKPEKEKEKNKDKGEKVTKKPDKTPENQQKNEEMPQGNGEVAEGATAPVKDEEFELEPMELPPFEIIIGYDRHFYYLSSQTGSTAIFLSLSKNSGTISDTKNIICRDTTARHWLNNLKGITFCLMYPLNSS